MNKSLTPKRQRVKDLLMKGLSNSQISATLGISEKGVKENLTVIYKALGVKSRSELLYAELTKEKDEALGAQARYYTAKIQELQSELAALRAAKASNKYADATSSTLTAGKN